MRKNEETKISIYLYIVLLVSQSGMQLSFLSFMGGINQILFAGVLLVVGFFMFYKKGKLYTHSLGMKMFWSLLIALILSVFMAYIEWEQDFITSIVLYRHHIWIFYLPLFFYIKPSLKSISDALFLFTLTSLFVWIGQALGLIHINFRETIWGDVMDERNEFGGYGMHGVRLIAFSLYLFIGEMMMKFSTRNIIRVLITLSAVVLSSQRAMMLFALPLTAYVFLFKIKMTAVKKTAISLLFIILAIVFFINTSDIWLSFIEETTEQLGDKDYNRWMAVDYFLNNYSKGISPLIFGNGFLSLKNAGGQLIQNLGYMGIFIDDIGMLCVWVRYGVVPLIILYFIVWKTLFSKRIPLYLKLVCIHIGFLPTSWTLVGFHWFVFIFLIYLYCTNKDQIMQLQRL